MTTTLPQTAESVAEVIRDGGLPRCEGHGVDDIRHTPLRPIDPPRPVAVDLTEFGPRRVRWGSDTPQWTRASGWRPDRAVPAIAEWQMLSMYGDWWVYCRTDLVNARGESLHSEVGLLLPSSAVSTRS